MVRGRNGGGESEGAPAPPKGGTAREDDTGHVADSKREKTHRTRNVSDEA